MRRCPLSDYKPNTEGLYDPKALDAATKRLTDSAKDIGAPSKFGVLNPKNWPPKVRLVVVAALAAGLGAAGVPQGIVALVTQLFGG